MKRFKSLLVVLSISSAIFLTSCEEPENQIVGLWRYASFEQTVTEDGELTSISTRFYTDDETIYWEFQDQSLLLYEGKEMELEETYTWEIENGDALFLIRENLDDYEFEILTLTRKDLVLKEEEYQTADGDLTVFERVFKLERVEE